MFMKVIFYYIQRLNCVRTSLTSDS